jgi:hypothetical protein
LGSSARASILPANSGEAQADAIVEALEKEFGDLAKIGREDDWQPGKTYTEREQFNYFGLQIAREKARRRAQADEMLFSSDVKAS